MISREEIKDEYEESMTSDNYDDYPEDPIKSFECILHSLHNGSSPSILNDLTHKWQYFYL